MFQTDYAVPTGEFVEEWLEDHDMNQAELARRTGVSRKHISKVIGGAPVTPDFAQKLALTTGVPAERWLALEAAYRSDLSRLAMQEELADKRELAEAFKDSASRLRRLELIDADLRRPGVLLMQLMAFFGVGHVDALQPSVLMPQTRFLQSSAFTTELASVATWLRLAELQAQSDPVPAPYDEQLLRSVLPEIRSLSRTESDLRAAAAQRLADAGVIVIRLAEIPGCRALGATFWTNGHPVVVLSARGKTDGALWFALFHELGHVLLHPGSTQVDDEAAESSASAEAAAHRFAEDHLVPPELRDRLLGVRSKDEIRVVAEESDIAPGILLHHMHHHGLWEHRHGRGLYIRVEFDELA